MFHSKRTWGPPARVETAEELAEKLTEHTWTLCTAFENAGYLYLNDATSGDGAGEFAVLKRLPDGTFLEVASITFSWCTREKALRYIQDVAAGKFDEEGRPVRPRIDDTPGHRCDFCA